MKHLYLTAAFSLLASAALAQESAPVFEGSSYMPPPGSEREPSPVGPAQMEIRLSTLENEIRALRGKNEENDFQIRRLTDALEKMQRDVDMRFQDLHGKPGIPVAQPSPQPTEATPVKLAEPDKAEPKIEPVAEPESSGHASPRDLYNAAFRLLNQTKYEEASAAFLQFTKKHPKDPLVGNAYYWAGETHYIRRDYVTAADYFRQGFEALPEGPKAPDNLLKLAMSLDALKRNKEACVVLGQVVTKFKKTSPAVADKAASEQKRIACA